MARLNRYCDIQLGQCRRLIPDCWLTKGEGGVWNHLFLADILVTAPYKVKLNLHVNIYLARGLIF